METSARTPNRAHSEACLGLSMICSSIGGQLAVTSLSTACVRFSLVAAGRDLPSSRVSMDAFEGSPSSPQL